MTELTFARNEERPLRRALPAVMSNWLVPAGLLAAGVVLWSSALQHVDLRKLNDLGLVSVLQPRAYIALALLSASFCICLRDPAARKPLLVANVLILIGVLYALPGIVEAEPKLAAAWRHVGVIETIGRTGHVDPRIDAYFDWPGFFISSAFLTAATGVKSAVAFARFAPVFFNLLYLLPLIVIFRTATRDERAIWLALWLFLATNWVSQDYFSPQGYAYFLYLVLLAIVLRYFVGHESRKRWWRTEKFQLLGSLQMSSAHDEAPAVDPPAAASDKPTDANPLQRLGGTAVAIALLLVLAPSHQLMPFAAVLGLGALVLSGYTSTRGLFWIGVVAIGAWMAFMAADYLHGHLSALTKPIGHLDENVQSTVGARLGGSAYHRDVVDARLLLTGMLWGLAAFGVARAVRGGARMAPYLALTAAPFALLVLQPYGGEMLLRVYFFILPFMALFASILFCPSRDKRTSFSRTLVIGMLSVALLSGFLVARYGNERVEYFTRSDVQAVRALYQVARPGSFLVAGSRNLPWKYKGYDEYRYGVIADLPEWKHMEAARGNPARLVDVVAAFMRQHKGPGAYLITTASENAYLQVLGYARADSLARFERAVEGSHRFRRIYENPQANVFALVGGRGGRT